MATRIAVPDRPNLDPNAYTLGQDPNWLANYSGQAGETRGEAMGLSSQGKSLAGQAGQVQGRATPETNFASADAMGQQQVRAGNWLANFANAPQGPSAAQAQLQQGANQSMAQSLALARSGGGFGESATGLAQAQRANADTMANASNQAAMLRAQEDQNFRAQQVQAMGTAADIYGGASAQQAARSQYLTDAELQAQQQRDAQQLGLSQQGIDAQNAGIQNAIAAQGMGLDAANAELNARVAQGQTEAQNYGTEADVFATREARDRALADQRRADRGEAAGLVGTVAGAAAAMLSDVRYKRDIRPVSLSGAYREGDSGGGGAEGLARRDYETYQGEMTPRARARDYGAFEEADRQRPEHKNFGDRLASGLRVLSDERTKTRLRRIRDELDAAYAALEGSDDE